MIIGHLPAGYLLAHVVHQCHSVAKVTNRKLVLFAALIGSIFPDIDLLYFYRRLAGFFYSAIEVKPTPVLTYKATNFVQAMCTAVDLVARHKFDTGMIVVAIGVPDYFQAQPSGFIIQTELQR